MHYTEDLYVHISHKTVILFLSCQSKRVRTYVVQLSGGKVSYTEELTENRLSDESLKYLIKSSEQL